MAKLPDKDNSWGVWPIPDALLCVDPGLNSCGYAYWANTSVGAPGYTRPTAVGLIKPTRTLRLGERMRIISDELLKVTGRQPFGIHFVIEMPAFQGGAQREMGWKTGDLQKLVLLVGFLCAHDWGRVTLVTPRDWKGQLPKDVVERRLRKLFGLASSGPVGIEKDAWDAAGIGVYMLNGRV